MDRQTKIYVYSTISILGLSFLGYRSIKRGQSHALLIKKISNLNVIDSKKINDVLNGVFHTGLGTSKPFIVLKEDKKRSVSEELDNALSGIFTDEDGLYSILGSLSDKVAVSQVSAYFKAKTGESLFEKLKDELNKDEQAQVNKIINSKPDVRWLN